MVVVNEGRRAHNTAGTAVTPVFLVVVIHNEIFLFFAVVVVIIVVVIIVVVTPNCSSQVLPLCFVVSL
jgi:hypothetical protein